MQEIVGSALHRNFITIPVNQKITREEADR